MSSIDFRADQIQTKQIIVTGSGAGTTKLLVYGIEAQGSPVNEGVINTTVFPQTGIGTDVFLYVSGALNTKGSATVRGTSVFGGDLVVSGSLYNGEVAATGGNYSHAEGHKTTAGGLYSHAEGYETYIFNRLLTYQYGDYAHVEGRETSACGDGSHAEGYGTAASGSYSHVEGSFTRADGFGSHAEGALSNASGSFSHAEGTSVASGIGAHSEGFFTFAVGDYSHAEGTMNLAYGNAAHAEGTSTTTAVHGFKCIIGDSPLENSKLLTIPTPSGDVTSVFPLGSKILVDDGSSNFGMYQVALSGIVAPDYQILAFKVNISQTIVTNTSDGKVYSLDNLSVFASQSFELVGLGAHAEGLGSWSIGTSAHAEGHYSRALYNDTHAEGIGGYAAGEGSHAEGHNTIVNYGASYSHVEGDSNIVSGFGAHAEGYQTVSIGDRSHTEGQGTLTGLSGFPGGIGYVYAIPVFAIYTPPILPTTALDTYFAVGESVIVDDNVSGLQVFTVNSAGYVAPNYFIGLQKKYDSQPSLAAASIGCKIYPLYGQSIYASSSLTFAGTGAHAEGSGSIAIGTNGHSEGKHTRAIYDYSHAEGSGSVAAGEGSHAEGFNTVVNYGSDYSHAEGHSTQTIGDYSHAEGSGTTAIGVGSHAQGSGSVSWGIYSFAAGNRTIASGSVDVTQAAFGRFNKRDNTTSLFVIGNGTGDSNALRKDIFRAESTGELVLSGGIRHKALYTTSSFTLEKSDYLSIINTQSGDVDVYLPNITDTINDIGLTIKIRQNDSATSGRYVNIYVNTSNVGYTINGFNGTYNPLSLGSTPDSNTNRSITLTFMGIIAGAGRWFVVETSTC